MTVNKYVAAVLFLSTAFWPIVIATALAVVIPLVLHMVDFIVFYTIWRVL